MEVTPRPCTVNNCLYYSTSIPGNCVGAGTVDNCLVWKAVNSHQALVDALANSHKWLMKICQSHIGGDATEMSFNKQELSDNLKALKAAGEVE